MYAGVQETNWIPRSFQQAARNLAKEVVERFVKPNQIIGLGSGPMAAAIVREMANFDSKETLECIPTSFQIKLEAQYSGLKLVGEDRMPEVDVVFEIGRASCRERGQICVREFRCITQQL